VVADARRYLELTHQEKLERARAIVATASNRLREAVGGGHVEEVVRVGEPTREVLALASEVAADLIAAGARGRSGVRELLLGSTSEGLVTEASCPVLIVRQTPPVLSEVLIAAATPEDAERLTEAALALPLAPSVRIVAATVVRSGQDLSAPAEEAADPEVDRLHDALRQLGADEGATAQAAIDRIVALARARGHETEALVLRGDAGDTLLQTAAERGTCLIVVGAREHSGIGGWLGLGSVSRKLVRRTGSAVLVVRPS
jgi:nucleotide-binding universal stress UspA family protein